MQKCDYCTGIGREPACVEHCPTEALRYGTMDELSRLAAEKGAHKLEGTTGPSLFIFHKREDSKFVFGT
jgi:Fe-S-cluster-containing hydrogenase component 2